MKKLLFITIIVSLAACQTSNSIINDSSSSSLISSSIESTISVKDWQYMQLPEKFELLFPKEAVFDPDLDQDYNIEYNPNNLSYDEKKNKISPYFYLNVHHEKISMPLDKILSNHCYGRKKINDTNTIQDFLTVGNISIKKVKQICNDEFHYFLQDGDELIFFGWTEYTTEQGKKIIEAALKNIRFTDSSSSH